MSKKTLIVFSGEYDRVMAAFIIRQRRCRHG